MTRLESVDKERNSLSAMEGLQRQGWKLEDEILESKQRIALLESQLSAMHRIVDQIIPDKDENP